jgi:hypothetical protein
MQCCQHTIEFRCTACRMRLLNVFLKNLCCDRSYKDFYALDYIQGGSLVQVRHQGVVVIVAESLQLTSSHVACNPRYANTADQSSIRFEEITRVQDAYWKWRSKDAHHTINP